MNGKAKGSRSEYKSKALLEAAGYLVTKAGASLGMWDLIGIRADGFVVCQVKSSRWPGLAEMNAMRNCEVPANCRKLVHRWDDYAREPLVREVGNPEPASERGLTLPELLEMRALDK